MNSIETTRWLSQIPGYAENIFINTCGPMHSKQDLFKRLRHLPACMEFPSEIPPPVLLECMGGLQRLHLPSEQGIELAQTIGMMMRQGYVHRNPKEAINSRQLYSPIRQCFSNSAVQLAATVSGLSGVGKSQAVERALSMFPDQVVIHEKVPGFASPVHQLLWLKVDIPASGKIADFVEALAIATDLALGSNITSGLFTGRRRSGAAMAMEWLARVTPFFPGLLVFDEMQNLFKIASMEARARALKRSSTGRTMLRVADDETLKLLLTLTNTSKFPILVVSTPDGLAAFDHRTSTAQRLVTAGFFKIPHPESAEDPIFSQQLFRCLQEYQFLPERIEPSDELKNLIFELSAGIPRICVALWAHANLRAVQRRARCIGLEDFRHVARTRLAPLQPAVKALLSRDPLVQRRYEDLLPPANDDVWNLATR